MLDPNEAPNGYIAVLNDNLHKCFFCCFSKNTPCNVECDEDIRKDRCSVVFKNIKGVVQ